MTDQKRSKRSHSRKPSDVVLSSESSSQGVVNSDSPAVISASSGGKRFTKNTHRVNVYPSPETGDDQKQAKKRKKKSVLDPNFRYRVSPKQVAINVHGESQLINGIKIEMYVPLVKWLAGKISAYLPPHVDREELVSEGFCGLLEAAYKYNAEKGRFETFARNRICGSMQDWLRSIDRLPRSAREAMRRIEAAEDELTIELRRPPTMNEIAEKMNVSVANLSRRKNRLDMDHSGVTVSLKTKAHVTDSSKIGDESSLTSPQPAYLDAPMGHEMMENIVDDIVVSIHAIPERDKAICLFSIVEGADIGDIVTLMNTNPGRVKAAKETLAKVARVKIF